MALVGNNSGVEAFGVINYAGFIFISIIIGFAIGVSPIISFHYGAKNHEELKALYKKCMKIIILLSVVLFIAVLALGYPMSYLFVGSREEVFSLAVEGFFLYSFGFFFVGVNIFSSAFFTALNDGLTSAILSILRTLVLPSVCIFVLPLFLDITGVWLAFAVSEAISIIASIIALIVNRNKFNY
jgi:Na+-driven multidrug efflux pump